MIDLLFFIVLILIVAYFYNYPLGQINNAAPTFLQIWTGNCNLSCQQSGYSRFSGMSGLYAPPLTPAQDTTAGGESQQANIVQRISNSVSNCVCHPCPCAHIEAIIRTCRPATDIYTRNMETLGFYLAISFELISDTYEKISNAMQCGTSCQRQAEYVQTTKNFVIESNENLTFDREKTENKKNKPVFPKISGMLHLKTRSESTLKTRSESAVNKNEETTKPLQIKNAETTKPLPTKNEESTKSLSTKNEETTKSLPTKNEETTKSLSTKNEETTKSLPTKNKETTKPLPTKNEETTKSLSTKNEETTKSLPTKNEETTKPLPTKNEETKKPLPDKNEETTKSLPTRSETKSDYPGPSQEDDACPTAQMKTDDMSDCGGCPRCIQDGKVCISKCPKAK